VSPGAVPLNSNPIAQKAKADGVRIIGISRFLRRTGRAPSTPGCRASPRTERQVDDHRSAIHHYMAQCRRTAVDGRIIGADPVAEPLPMAASMCWNCPAIRVPDSTVRLRCRAAAQINQPDILDPHMNGLDALCGFKSPPVRHLHWVSDQPANICRAIDEKNSRLDACNGYAPDPRPGVKNIVSTTSSSGSRMTSSWLTRLAISCAKAPIIVQNCHFAASARTSGGGRGGRAEVDPARGAPLRQLPKCTYAWIVASGLIRQHFHDGCRCDLFRTRMEGCSRVGKRGPE